VKEHRKNFHQKSIKNAYKKVIIHFEVTNLLLNFWLSEAKQQAQSDGLHQNIFFQII